MIEKSQIINVALCDSQSSHVQFVVQQIPQKPDAKFDVIIPGRILRIEGITAQLSVRPKARVVINDGEVTRFATVSANVIDEDGLTQELCKLEEEVEFKAVENFLIRFASDKYSFRDIVEAAEDSLDSDCGTVASKIGHISVGVSADQLPKNIVWTKPVRLGIKAWCGSEHRYGPFDPEAKFASRLTKPSYYSNSDDEEECDSEWWCDWFYQNRETTCHGGCDKKGEICNCGKNKKGFRQIACKGWSFCWCN